LSHTIENSAIKKIRAFMVLLLLMLVVMQSILSYVFALTLEHKRSEIATLIDQGASLVYETHQSHLSQIKGKIDDLISCIEKLNTEDSEEKGANRNFSYFVLYFQAAPKFEVLKWYFPKLYYYIPLEALYHCAWAHEQLHPPQV
jgi:hypothetical protein